MGAAKVEHWEFECDHCKATQEVTVRIHMQAEPIAFSTQKTMALPAGWTVFQLDCFCPNKACQEQLAWRQKCEKELNKSFEGKTNG